MGRTATIFLAAMLFVPLAHAASSIDHLNVFNNMAQETVECAAYFGIMSVALENSNDTEGAKKYKEVMLNALKRAAMVTEKAGLKPETVHARFQIAADDMMKRIDKNTSNVSILMTHYKEPCIEVMTDVEKRGRYWMERGLKRFEDGLPR